MIRTKTAVACCLVGSVALASASPPDLRTEIVQSLRHDALEGFSGTVSYDEAVNASSQHWEITLDDEGQLSARILLAQSDLEVPMLVGQSHGQLWFADGNVLYVWNRDLLSTMKELELAGGRRGLARDHVRAAFHDLNRLFGPRAERSESVSIEVLEKDSESPAAMVKIDGKPMRVSFVRVDGVLLMSSIVRESQGIDGRMREGEWSFSDYRRMGNRWIPGTVRFREQGKDGVLLNTLLFEKVRLEPSDDTAALRRAVQPPDNGGPGHERIDFVELHSRDRVQWKNADTGSVLR